MIFNYFECVEKWVNSWISIFRWNIELRGLLFPITCICLHLSNPLLNTFFLVNCDFEIHNCGWIAQMGAVFSKTAIYYCGIKGSLYTCAINHWFQTSTQWNRTKISSIAKELNCKYSTNTNHLYVDDFFTSTGTSPFVSEVSQILTYAWRLRP